MTSRMSTFAVYKFDDSTCAKFPTLIFRNQIRRREEEKKTEERRGEHYGKREETIENGEERREKGDSGYGVQ